MTKRVSGTTLMPALGALLLLGCSSPEYSSAGVVRDVSPGSAAPPPVASAGADTAGIGAHIAAAFPGWRLSTEAEIAARFSDAYSYMDPKQMWQPSSFGMEGQWMGSGQPWWIWRGDFDGDGTQDVLTFLSEETDPSQGKVVVLHGNGAPVEIKAEDGDGIAEVPSEDGSGRVQIVWQIWDKTGGTYEWNPETQSYESVEPERECC